MESSTSPRTAEPCPLQASPISCMPRERDFHIRDCSTPPYDGSTDDMSDKEANKPMFFRCLLLLLPVAIPVVVYLKDIDSMRRIFLTAFIMMLVIVLSCMMVALLRKRRRNAEGQPCNGEVARELAHRHFVAMTHRFLPRTPLPLAHGRCRGDCEFNPEARRPHSHSYRPTYSRAPTHYHLASTMSRSPSPQSNLFGSGPLPLLSLHFPRVELLPPDGLSPRCDDPPSYEDAILCPPEIPHQSRRQNPSPPETPPPPYEMAVG